MPEKSPARVQEGCMMEIVVSGIIIGDLWFVALPSKNPAAVVFFLALGIFWALILAYFTAVDFKKRRSIMAEETIKGKVVTIDEKNVYLEFGSTQAEFQFSSKGNLARKLKLKEGQKVEVTIKA